MKEILSKQTVKVQSEFISLNIGPRASPFTQGKEPSCSIKEGGMSRLHEKLFGSQEVLWPIQVLYVCARERVAICNYTNTDRISDHLQNALF
jgi:hypothetical protein